MTMLIWNCRGAGKSRFPGLIRDYVRLYKLSFLAILESRISGDRPDLTLLVLQVAFGAFGRGIGSPLMSFLPLSTASS